MTATLDQVLQKIDDRVDEMVELTRDLIRFPTINPPGEAYRPCAEFIGDRLSKRGFDIEYVRADGTPGDSEKYPRVNVIARREGSRNGPCVHFNGHIDVVEVELEIADYKIFARRAVAKIEKFSEGRAVAGVVEHLNLRSIRNGVDKAHLRYASVLASVGPLAPISTATAIQAGSLTALDSTDATDIGISTQSLQEGLAGDGSE